MRSSLRNAPSLANPGRTDPWSGHYDGKVCSSPTGNFPLADAFVRHQFLWGRGSADCKNTLSGTLEAVTLLLEQGFQPRRTILLSYGFDEESKGWEGAGRISEHLESVYGEDGIAFILDEGGLGIGEMYGSAFALPATGEKVLFLLVCGSLGAELARDPGLSRCQHYSRTFALLSFCAYS